MKIPSLEEMYSPSRESWSDRHRISKKYGGDFPYARSAEPRDQNDNFTGMKKVKIYCSEIHRRIRLNKQKVNLKDYFETHFCTSCRNLSFGKGNSVLD
jgi:hypothetical protein